MKRFFLVIVVLFLGTLISSCERSLKVTENRMTLSPNIELCKKMRGIGSLVIDKTTYKEMVALTKKGSSFTAGTWSTHSTEAGVFIEQKNPRIKQINVSGLKLGSVQLKGWVSLAFLDNTLVAIDLTDCYHQIESALKTRCGTGEGFVKSTVKQRGKSNSSDYYYEIRKEESRIWQNSNVKLEYIKTTVSDNIKPIYPDPFELSVLFDDPWSSLKENDKERKEMLSKLHTRESLALEEITKQFKKMREAGPGELSTRSVDVREDSYINNCGRLEPCLTYERCLMVSNKRYNEFISELFNTEVSFYRGLLNKKRSSLEQLF